MSTTAKPSSKVDPRITAVVAHVADELGLKATGRRRLEEFLIELVGASDRKLDYVSFYPAKTRHGGINWRVDFKVPGYPDRTERLGRQHDPAYQRAKRISEILAQVKARLLKPGDAHRLLYVDSSPVVAHVKAFERHLRSGGAVDQYVKTTITRLNRCLELAGVERLGDIRRSMLAPLIEKLKAFVDPRTSKPMRASTINDHLAVFRQFTKWATPTLLREDPLFNSTGIKNTEQQKRRDLVEDELAWMIKAAEAGQGKWKMRGADRAMLYLAGYATGLRRRELRLLQVPWLKLDAHPSFIAVPANVTKNGKEAQQPLPDWFADQLRNWIGDRKTGRVWPNMTKEVEKMFERDRHDGRQLWIAAGETEAERARRAATSFLARKTSDGELVFHSLRHTYASRVMAAIDPKNAQILTRHSTLSMLMETYAHGRLAKAAEGVNKAIKQPVSEESKAQVKSAVNQDGK